LATHLPTEESPTESGGDMRQVTYKDRNGYLRVSLIRDTDPEDMAPKGLPVGPPDFELIDWEEVKRQLSNLLVERGILTYTDIQHNPSAVSSCVRSCLTSRVVNVYKQMEGTL
jgi:hypothetical protein